MAFWHYMDTEDMLKFAGAIAFAGLIGFISGEGIIDYSNESRIKEIQQQLNENIGSNHDVKNFQFKTLAFGKEEGEEKYFVEVIGTALKMAEDDYKYFSFKYAISKEDYEKMKKQYSSELSVNEQGYYEPSLKEGGNPWSFKPVRYFKNITNMAKEQKAYEINEIISVKDFQGMHDAVGIDDAVLTDYSNIIENGNKAESALGFITADGKKLQRHIVVLSQDKKKIIENADFFKEGAKIEIHHEGKREQDLLWKTQNGYVNVKALDQGLHF